MLGDNLENWFSGDDGADTLNGRGGNDHLNGDEGKDTLIGGAGRDDFNFWQLGSAHADTVKDFVHGADQLWLNPDFGGLSGSQLAAGAFRSGAGFTTAADANDRVIYNETDGKLYFDADGNGGGSTAQLFAILTGSPDNVTASDFQIFT